MNRLKKAKANNRSLFARDPGQAIVIIALVMVALLGFTALAIDGGQLYFLQRDAQNAADAAIVAALFEMCKDPNMSNADRATAAIAAGQNAAIQNGFDDAADNVTVTVTVPYDAGAGLSYKDVEVIITASKPAQLVQVVYQGPLEVRARTAGHCSPAYQWNNGATVFAGGPCSHAFDFTGSSMTLTGIPNAFYSGGETDLHGNSGGGGGSTVTGQGNVAPPGTINSADGVTYANPSTGNPDPSADVQEMPVLWRIEDFTLYGRIADKATSLGTYYYIAGDMDRWTDAPGSGHPKPGIYFATGSISLNSGQISGTNLTGITFVANGKIDISFGGTGPTTPLQPYDLLGAMTAAGDPDIDDPRYAIMPAIFTDSDRTAADLCDNDNDISSTGRPQWFGVMYAPNGQISLSFSNGGSGDGAVIAYRVSLSGSNFTLNYNPDWIPPIPPEVGITG